MSDAAPPGQAQNDPEWYRDAVIYQLHVKSFFDSNDDGIGDFRGLTSRLDYIAALGVDTLWLLPFYPSPRRDDGYDVADFVGVSPDYGSLEDLCSFIEAAHARGIRVLGDLVLNHTSDAHPWFQRARAAPRDSAEHAYYVWSDSDQRYSGTRIIFPDVEKSNWAWDPVAERYYFHRFYSHQPDLNYDCPQVIEEMVGVLRRWLDIGLDGFRLDAVAYLVERDGSSNENLPETHAILKRLRAEIDAHYPGRVLLAEANQWPEDMQAYFGADDECHMAFHFPLMPRMYMALAQEDRFPVTDILRQTPPTPPRSQWAIFLRNHDELTLEMVTDAERDYLWNTYAADPRARLNLGIRRRLAPLLERDRRRIELMTALLLTLPGTPVLYYGDEIGMGDNIHLGDRDGVRTPMHWSVDRNGGFSRADAHRLVLPILMDPLYGYQSVNVEAQERDPHSLLHWVRRLIHVRRRYGPLFGRGGIDFLAPRNRRVLAYFREESARHLLCVANLARTLQGVELDLSRFEGRVPVDALGGAALPTIGRGPYLLTLPPYGFLVLELASHTQLPDWHSPEPPMEVELPTLVLQAPLAEELGTRYRSWLERDALPKWLQRRTFPPLSEAEEAVSITSVLPTESADDVLLTMRQREEPLAPLPLSVLWDPLPGSASHALARVRRGARIGLLADTTTVPAALRRWRSQWTQSEPPKNGMPRFFREPDTDLPEPREPGIEAIGDASANVVLLDDALLVRVARGRTQALEESLEIVQRLSRLGYPHSLPLIGSMQVVASEGAPILAYSQAWRDGSVDAATWTRDFLQRTLHEFRAASSDARDSLILAYGPLAALLGQRLAELHVVLADEFGVANEGDTPLPVERIVQRITHSIDAASGALQRAGLDPLSRKDVLRRIRSLGQKVATQAVPARQRIHGSPALANLLLTANDVVFLNFGSPAGRRDFGDGLASPLDDVASLLVSLSDAAATMMVEHSTDDAAAADFASGFLAMVQPILIDHYLAVPTLLPKPQQVHLRRCVKLLQVQRICCQLEAAITDSAFASTSWSLRATLLGANVH